ncbi:MAG TPA: protein translocase subunit SecD [Bacillota bacterium]|nr:protein translocase subunit SecD [Bacillota bacterium]
MKQDLRWKVSVILLAALIFGLLLSPVGNRIYKTDPIRYGLDLKGGIELLLMADYRIGTPQLTKLKEDLLTKLNAANISAPVVEFLGTPDNNRCEGLKLTFATEADATRAKNINAFPAKYKLDFYGEEKNLVMEVNATDPNAVEQTAIPGNVIELKVNQDPKDFPSDALERAKVIVENRISDAASGMAEAQVQVDQNGRLNVQLPGINSLDQARDIITSTGRLTFRIDKRVVVDGADMEPDINVNYDASAGYCINFKFSGDGARQLAKVTTENVGKNMAIYLDETELINPVIKSPLPDGGGRIEMGNTPKEEVQKDALLMKSGALPISLRVVQSNQVDPTLGKEIIRLSLYAMAAGIILVILFMLIFYGLPGLLADGALVIYGVCFLGVMVLFRGVLTLPGIAGFILSMGMAVDANVIIFERIKDELRSGKRVRAAIDAGFDRAFVAIIDSNITTLIAAGVLLFFGTGPVKGFAVTLSIGVLISMFTAIFVTRTFIELKVDRDPDRYAGQFGFKEGVQ